MKRTFILCLFLCSCAAPYGSYRDIYPVTPHAYGLGTGMASDGEAVTLHPTHGGEGYYGDSMVVRPNAYGLGAHMDQYGRMVTW